MAALEKANHELRWQVAMLARPEGLEEGRGPGIRKALSAAGVSLHKGGVLDRWITAGTSDPGRGRLVGVVGLVLRCVGVSAWCSHDLSLVQVLASDGAGILCAAARGGVLCHLWAAPQQRGHGGGSHGHCSQRVGRGMMNDL